MTEPSIEPTPKLTSDDLARYIQETQVRAEVIRLPVHTPTVEAAANAVGTRPERIVKSLVFLIDGRPILAIATGLARVDQRLIAGHYDVGRKRVKLADADTVLSVTGYAVGSVPPFGHLRRLETLLDRSVLAHDEVYAGGGEVDALLRIAPAEIQRITHATPVDLQAPGDPALA